MSKTANKSELYPLQICPLGSDLMLFEASLEWVSIGSFVVH
jgi:hypothetical protein